MAVAGSCAPVDRGRGILGVVALQLGFVAGALLGGYLAGEFSRRRS